MVSVWSVLATVVCAVTPLAAAGTNMAVRRTLQQQGGGSGCAWNEDYDKCMISKKTVDSFLEEVPESVVKESMSEVLDCMFTGGNDTCTSKDYCRWSQTMEWCTYKVNHIDQEHFQRCVGDSVVFLRTSDAFKACQAPSKDAVSCDLQVACGWDEEREVCEFDAWKYLTGIPSEGVSVPLPKGLDLLLEIRSQQLGQEIAAANLKEDFEILKWSPSRFQCPMGVDLAVCRLVEMGDSVAIIKAYCNAIRSDNGCEEDARCTESCEPAESVVGLSRRAQTNTYLTLVGDQTSALVLRRHVECLMKPKTVCDEEEDCEWDADAGVCEAMFGYILRTIAQFPVNSQLPDCQTIQPLFYSGCIGLVEDICVENSLCLWSEEVDLCFGSPSAMLRGLLESIDVSDSLRQRAEESIYGCVDIPNTQSCN